MVWTVKFLSLTTSKIGDTSLCNTPNARENNAFPSVKKLGCYVQSSGDPLTQQGFYSFKSGDVGCLKTTPNCAKPNSFVPTNSSTCQENPTYSALSKSKFDEMMGKYPGDWRDYFKTFIYCNQEYCNTPEASGIKVDIASSSWSLKGNSNSFVLLGLGLLFLIWVWRGTEMPFNDF